MASNAETNEEQDLQRFHVRQRRALNDALGVLHGAATARSFQAFSFEDAVDLQIERIEGEGTPLRPNRLERVERIKNELVKAVAEMKALPPELFLDADPEDDVNTEA